jgi:hypothetical protein
MKSKINFTVQDIQEALTFWMREKRGIEITEFHRIEAEGVNSSLRVYAEVSQEELEGERINDHGDITFTYLGVRVSVVRLPYGHHAVSCVCPDNDVLQFNFYSPDTKEVIKTIKEYITSWQ